MNVQLTNCKKVILLFDRIEEYRELARHEFILRNKLRERAYQLANNEEKRWRQRARCKWLSQGDKNTRYFHAFASSRRQRNRVMSLNHDGQLTTGLNQIKQLFTEHMKAGLGTSNPTLAFQPSAWYHTDPTLQQLVNPISDEEIESAIRGLEKNKASGPDGIPNEFVQRYWPDLKDELTVIIMGFFNNQIDLNESNRADVVMIPKTDTPLTVGDFRPISIINIIPKIISKILANRLRDRMPDLISPNQTAFIRGRQITDNFVATREILHHISDTKRPAVFIKLDFAKAFDSIEWDFLIKVMEARGFPSVWICWIRHILTTAHSRVLINGEQSEYFVHKRGLRQGDPLSPLLFNIAADVLQQMIKEVNKGLPNELTRKIKESMMALQYADDTAIIASADISTVVSLKIIIRLFASISGLKINYKKSTFIPLNILQGDIQWIHFVLGCQQSQFPIQYLGLPLTIVKPTKAMYMPLIEKLEKKLGGWKGKMLSRGGRLQLVRSVCSSIPIYHMCCFRLPQWVVNRIDRIRRGFLWGRNGENERGMSLMNWEMVCWPREYGGMGISNLHMVNTALLLRWWWKAYKEPGSLWAITVGKLRIKRHMFGPRFWNISGSFFWIQLGNIKGLFINCTAWEIGDGRTIAYWLDGWNRTPKATSMVSKELQPFINLRDAQQVLEEIDPEEATQASNITFTNNTDRLYWKLENNEGYTSKSAYGMLSQFGRIRGQYTGFWKCKIPLSVKIFAFLMLHGRILTKEVLLRRGMQIPVHCVMCSNAQTESIAHVLFQCPYAMNCWSQVTRLLNTKLTCRANSLEEIVHQSWKMVRAQRKMHKKEWMCRFICVAWEIWKQRNAVIFREQRLSSTLLAERCCLQMKMWLKWC